MNLSNLCDKIELQPQMKTHVFAFADEFDFQTIDTYQKEYLIYQNMKEARIKIQSMLGEDPDGVKILTCKLKASVDAYEIYQKK